eukprot:2245120-Pyramimonas_sp.AAC.1
MTQYRHGISGYTIATAPMPPSTCSGRGCSRSSCARASFTGLLEEHMRTREFHRLLPNSNGEIGAGKSTQHGKEMEENKATR